MFPNPVMCRWAEGLACSNNNYGCLNLKAQAWSECSVSWRFSWCHLERTVYGIRRAEGLGDNLRAHHLNEGIPLSWPQIQRMVISGGNFKPDTLKPKEVVSLLLDDEELEKKREFLHDTPTYTCSVELWRALGSHSPWFCVVSCRHF